MASPETFDIPIGKVVGPKGDTGNGIASIELLSTSGLNKTYRITMTDETHFDFVVTDGNGISGATFDAQTNALTLTFQNGTTFTTPSLKGAKGDTGNGISRIEKTGTDGLVDTYTVTYTNGQTYTYTVTNGADGVSPAVTVETITDGHRVTITDKDHPTGQSFDVMDGEDGASDAGDVTYDSTETYQSGTAGAALNDLSRQLSDLDSNINIVELYSGIPNNAATLFNIDNLQGAKSFYYNFDAVEGKYLYIELMNSSGSRITYIGKGSSSSGALHYEGYENVPEGFLYAKFTTNADITSGYKINVIGFYPTSEMYQKTIKGLDVSYVFPVKYTDYYVDNRVVGNSGQSLVVISYGFSLANIRLNAGKKLAIVVPNYTITGHLYNEYGDWVRMIGTTHEVFKYEATENCHLRCNIVADDTTVTFNNDFVEKSGVEVYSDQENDIFPNSAQIINRVYIPASQHGNYKFIRIPSAKIMPNKKTIVAYEVRDSLSDASNSFIGYTIVSNGTIDFHGSVAEKESGEIRQFNPQFYTLSNGNILLLWTSNDANNTLYMHYAVSEDYGVTWSSASTIANTSDILTAPANGVWYNNKILIPIYKGSDFYDTSTLYSGLMLIDPTDMSHSEKFVAVAGTDECNVFLNGDIALLTTRQDGYSGISSPYRHMFTIDAALSGTFVERNNFYLISRYRTICQESYYKTDHMLYLCMANKNRVGIKLYASNDLSRKWTELVDVVKVTCGGYSCIDIEDNSMVVVTEGEDSKTTFGKQMFLDSVVIGSTV